MSTNRWSARLAWASAELDKIFEEKTAQYEADMFDLGADMDVLAKRTAQKRVEYEEWKITELARLERWFNRGGEPLH